MLFAFAAAAEETSPVPAMPEERLSRQQKQIADRYAHLEDVLLRMAELTAGTDPRRSALLRQAVTQSKSRLVGSQFDRMAALLQQGQLSRALENQPGLEQDLRALLELLLSENRARQLEAEKARVREYLKQVQRLIRQQRDVQGRTQGGAEPKQLSDQQSALADKTGRLADEMQKGEGKAENGESKADSGKGKAETTPGQQDGEQQGQQQQQQANPARKSLAEARRRMEEAERKLDQAQRTGAVEKQEEALRELEQAKAQLDEILRQLREEEIARTLAMLEARFKKMLDMQRIVYTGTQRLDAVPPRERTHGHEIEAGRLGDQEAQIVVEADKALALLREDGTAVAMPEAVQQMRDDMQQVVFRLARARVDRTTQAIEEDVLAALEEMIEALQRAIEQQEQRRQQSGSPQGRPIDPALVDVLAELKMIRALQMRVNRRTARYAKLIEESKAAQPDLRDALGRLAEREARIYRITRDLEMGKNE